MRSQRNHGRGVIIIRGIFTKRKLLRLGVKMETVQMLSPMIKRETLSSPGVIIIGGIWILYMGRMIKVMGYDQDL